MEETFNGRVTCPVCGRWVTKNGTGTLQRHKFQPKWLMSKRLHNDDLQPWCPGGGLKQTKGDQNMNGEWLEPPRKLHTEADCIQGRPKLTALDVGRHWRCATCHRTFVVTDTHDQRDPYWWKEVPVHAVQQVDGMPLCRPIEYWVDIHAEFKTSRNDVEVTCEDCKKDLDRMNRELGEV